MEGFYPSFGGFVANRLLPCTAAADKTRSLLLDELATLFLFQRTDACHRKLKQYYHLYIEHSHTQGEEVEKEGEGGGKKREVVGHDHALNGGHCPSPSPSQDVSTSNSTTASTSASPPSTASSPPPPSSSSPSSSSSSSSARDEEIRQVVEQVPSPPLQQQIQSQQQPQKTKPRPRFHLPDLETEKAIDQTRPMNEDEFMSQMMRDLQHWLAVYLSMHWNLVDVIHKANKCAIEQESEERDKDSMGSQDGEPLLLAREETWDELLRTHSCLFVFFTAPYCHFCHKLDPTFTLLAEKIRGRVVCCKVDGTQCPNLKAKYNVTLYPTLKLFKNGREFAEYPRTGARTLESLLAFIEHEGQVPKKSWGRDQWQNAMIRVKIQRDKEALASQRDWSTLLYKAEALGCADAESCAKFVRTFTPEEPPTIIFLGGGMGAGKSTVVKLLAKTKFMQKHGANVVTVEADQFKLHDPLFRSLRESRFAAHAASAATHSLSVQAAEELFLTAVQYRRDIIFDGTLMWLPFVKQTVEMVRDNRHRYQRGPGYHSKDGHVTEKYWEVVSECEEQVPYRIELVGVTVDPHVAVHRGITRLLLTGRSVPISGQLRSHKMFSENFATYTDWFDKVSLYDNNSNEPKLIAAKEVGDDRLRVLDEPLYDLFLDKANVNVEAKDIGQLYESSGMRKFGGHWENVVKELKFTDEYLEKQIASSGEVVLG